MLTEKILDPKDWNQYVKPGDRVFIGSGAGCPNSLVGSLLTRIDELNDLEFVHILTLGENPWLDPKYKDFFHRLVLFCF